MYILNRKSFIKMTVKDFKEFIFEDYFNRIVFTKEYSHCLLKKQQKEYLVLLATNLTKKITRPSIAKELHELFLKSSFFKKVF